MTDPQPIDPPGGSTVRVLASAISGRPSASSWGACADAVGHCLVVFTCVPPLAALPAWMLREASEPLNRELLLVLAFLPVRGVNLLLNAFARGVVQGVLAGVLAGGMLCAWSWWYADDAPRWQERMLGGIVGAIAAALVVAVTIALGWVDARAGGVPLAAVASEVGVGAVCGLLAGPRALALARATPAGADSFP